MRWLSLVPVILFGGLFVRDLRFYLGVRKWPIFRDLSRSPVGGWPLAKPVTEENREQYKKQTEEFIKRFDAPRTIFRIVTHNFMASLFALIVAALVAFLDVAS